MSKFLISALAGVFVGAFVSEMINRKKPGALQAVGKRTKRAVTDFGQAFAEGYRGTDKAKPDSAE